MTSTIDYSPLRKIGLSPAAITCYGNLYGNGWMVAAIIARRTQLSRSHTYEVLNELEARGFVMSFNVGIGASYYSAQHLEQALADYHSYQRLLLNDLTRRQVAHYHVHN